ncbi:unnamed protein product [Eruca vesicaria subsp. sativa]|uniref:F-box domain-containing protein n=1 Tax=Eruca vesicaria subsp. sativa TaxID=29727 RepID=A0ABC8LSW8_ERUVS|nr:unnamed protein product [Eruca vesicaria subsp. sativa]
MANFNLASLPHSLLHKILSKIATSNLRDFHSAIVAFAGFNLVGREEYLYRSADHFHLNDWIYEVNALTTFRLREKIHFAGERRLLLAKYVDGMLNLTFSVDDRGLVHNYPSFTREFIDRMYHMITTKIFSGHCAYEKPEMFMSLLKELDLNLSYDCWCSIIIELVFVVSIDGSRTRRRCNHCFW